MKKALAIVLSVIMVLSMGITSFAAETDYTISNPYADVDWDTFSAYKADLHSHTNASDGDNTTKEMAERLGYSVNMKEYKANPDVFKGSIADVTGFIRVALTNKQNTPDIYWIMQVLGESETKERLERVIK